MTGINHALTGASIALIIDKPLLALPLAFASHFLLDSMPHFGESFELRNKFSKSVWSVDGVLLVSFLIYLAITSNWIAFLGAILAISPDFAWIYRFTIAEKFGKLPPKPSNKFNQFHANIQKLEFRKGIFVEIVWFALFITIFINQV